MEPGQEPHILAAAAEELRDAPHQSQSRLARWRSAHRLLRQRPGHRRRTKGSYPSSPSPELLRGTGRSPRPGTVRGRNDRGCRRHPFYARIRIRDHHILARESRGRSYHGPDFREKGGRNLHGSSFRVRSDRSHHGSYSREKSDYSLPTGPSRGYQNHENLAPPTGYVLWLLRRSTSADTFDPIEEPNRLEGEASLRGESTLGLGWEGVGCYIVAEVADTGQDSLPAGVGMDHHTTVHDILPVAADHRRGVDRILLGAVGLHKNAGGTPPGVVDFHRTVGDIHPKVVDCHMTVGVGLGTHTAGVALPHCTDGKVADSRDFESGRRLSPPDLSCLAYWPKN